MIIGFVDRNCLLLSLVAIFFLSGCTPGGTWTHQYKKQNEFSSDDYKCARQASASTAGIQSPTLSLLLSSFHKQFYTSCMESLGWSKDDTLSEYNLNERERTILGAWLTKSRQVRDISISEAFDFLPDHTFRGSLKVKKDNENDPIFIAIDGDWELSETEMKMINKKSSHPYVKPGSVSILKIAHIGPDSFFSSDGIVYHRTGGQIGFKSRQTLVPTLGAPRSSRSYSSSRIVKENAYGPGIHKDQYGRAVTTSSGAKIVKENAYGPNIHMDQYGRPVTVVPR